MWIGILYLLDHDVSGYVTDLIDTLEGNNDRREFRSAINSILRVLPGGWMRGSPEDGSSLKTCTDIPGHPEGFRREPPPKGRKWVHFRFTMYPSYFLL